MTLFVSRSCVLALLGILVDQSLAQDSSSNEELTHILLPYRGTSLVKFGATPDDVESVLGPAQRTKKTRAGNRMEYRETCRVEYSNEDKVVEMTFWPPGTLLLDSRNLLQGSDQVKRLSVHDKHPLEHVGFVVFYELGLAMTGFHDGDKGQEAITIFSKGKWDDSKENMRPYKQP